MDVSWKFYEKFYPSLKTDLIWYSLCMHLCDSMYEILSELEDRSDMV